MLNKNSVGVKKPRLSRKHQYYIIIIINLYKKLKMCNAYLVDPLEFNHPCYLNGFFQNCLRNIKSKIYDIAKFEVQ